MAREVKSLRAAVVLGVNEGHGKNEKGHVLARAASVWQELAGGYYKETGIYVSAVAHRSKTIYHTDWGCPEGGEDTVTFTASANYEFIKDINAWKEAVTAISRQLKDRFEQESVTIEFEDISLIYLKTEKGNS
ncbi:hypothetical protein [Peribacillus sp. SCS-37]|uniref:hypothetical protein n=1 Tax=Paraperibacillus esterisolvens TaxID=3115296 RepID=UPI003905E6BD